MITVTLPSGQARTADSRDGALMDVHVTNVLSCVSIMMKILSNIILNLSQDIPANEIVVNLSGRYGAKLVFSEAVETLKPGKNIVTLFCHVCQISILFLSSDSHHILVCDTGNLSVP